MSNNNNMSNNNMRNNKEIKNIMENRRKMLNNRAKEMTGNSFNNISMEEEENDFMNNFDEKYYLKNNNNSNKSNDIDNNLKKFLQEDTKKNNNSLKEKSLELESLIIDSLTRNNINSANAMFRTLEKMYDKFDDENVRDTYFRVLNSMPKKPLDKEEVYSYRQDKNNFKDILEELQKKKILKHTMKIMIV